jgi:alpha-N-arabinofuranosidase
MNRKIMGLILAFSLCFAGMANKTEAKALSTTFQNPILTGFHPDPSLCRVGDDFYLTNSTFEFFPGLPLYHSRDLVHWKQIGNALNRPSQLPLKGATDGGGLYAPTLRYWKGLFYLTCCNVSGGGNFIVTAKDPAGPWSEPVWLNDFGIDGSLFFDDDGKIYYSRAGTEGQNGIYQAELDPASLKPKSSFKQIWSYPDEWNEGPHLYKIKGKYFLLIAAGGTGDRHTEIAARSDSPWGPIERCPYNPILTERDEPHSPIQCTGHADLFDAPDGTWWMVFLGTRPHAGMSVLGRETFLSPVHWTKDGWPVAGKDHHVALEMEAPKLKTFAVEPTPTKTLFNSASLGMEWLHVRNYHPDYFSLSERKGYLRIRTAPDRLSRKSEEPAFVGVRQSAFRERVRTAMEFAPAQDGEEAGLCVRSNDDNHYEIGLGRFDGITKVFVRNWVKSREYTIAQQSLNSSKAQLEIACSEDRYQFAWSADGQTWNTLAASPSGDLSKEKAGGFTGTTLGLYATSNGKPSNNHADFAWFEAVPGLVPEPVAISPRPTPTPLPSTDHWRIRVGGYEFRDKEGNDWVSDVGYIGGETAQTFDPIGGTSTQELYQTERWGQDFSYSLPVLPGAYKVHLRFAETYIKKEGQRIFDVTINGKKVLAHFDILKEAKGFDLALDRSFENIHPDADGMIRIRFVSSVQNAKVCAIEITRQS